MLPRFREVITAERGLVVSYPLCSDALLEKGSPDEGSAHINKEKRHGS